MSDTYTYTFTDPTDGLTDSITITVDPSTAGNPNDPAGTEQIASITGTIGGQAISGEAGGAGPNVTSADGRFIYDNDFAIGGNNANGVNGSVDGIDNSGLYFTVNGVNYNFYTDGGNFVLQDFNTTTNQYEGGPVGPVTTNAPCFCPGTMIATAAGERAVEDLAIGDLVTTLDGAQQPIRWIGRRVVATRFADPLTSMPVRISAGALADNVPARDCLLSPCHAVLVEGVLAQAGALVNGTSIVRESSMPETFTYYHIELANHALILADGMPAETFVDNVDRMAFDNWDEYQALVGDDAPMAEMALPRAKSARQLPASVRAHLAARSEVAIAA